DWSSDVCSSDLPRIERGPAMPALFLSSRDRRGSLFLSARIGRAGIVGGVLDLLADLLHVLAGTLHGVAGNEEVEGKQRKQDKGNGALHGFLLYGWGGPRGKSAARAVNETPSGCE